jgi:hypothetical protein
MPKPSSIITSVAGACMNDAAQAVYDNATCLPMLNLALAELQELYEQNDIPITNDESAAITIKAGVNRLGFDTTPAFPSNLIEIKQLWESTSGLDQWTPMYKKDTIPHYLDGLTPTSRFGIWALEQGRVKLIAANTDIDLKIDYIGSLFNLPILIKDINVNLPFTNVETYLIYKTGALCAMFIAENESRAVALDSLTGTALSRALGIPIKGMQSIITRRRPFRASYKRRGTNF